MLTIEQLSILIVKRLALVGEKLACLLRDGGDDCELEEVMCDIWRLKSIFDTINNEEALAAVEEIDPDIYNYFSNIVTTIGGIDEADFLVVDTDKFISLFQYFNLINAQNTGEDGDDCVCWTPIYGIGRNFSQPTLFNQLHDYPTELSFINAFLFPAQPPSISVVGTFILNDNVSYESFKLIPRGTIVRDVRVTVQGYKGANGGQIVETSTSLPSPTPSSPTAQTPANSVTQVYNGEINSDAVTTWSGADQANKTFSGSVKDSGNATNTANVSYSYGDFLFVGAATVPGGGVIESFIKALSQQILDTDAFQPSLSVTTGSGQHIWFASKDSLGEVVFTDLAVNISGGFTRVNGSTLLPNGETVVMPSGATIQITGENGYSVAYRVYVSDNANLGLVNFKTAAS